MESTFFWDDSPIQAGNVSLLPHDNDALMTSSLSLAFFLSPKKPFSPFHSFSLGPIESTSDIALVNPSLCPTHTHGIHISRLY
jgi:hypothetical protein